MKIFLCLTLITLNCFAKEISFKDLADNDVSHIYKSKRPGEFVGPPHIVINEMKKEESKVGYIPPRRPDYMNTALTSKGDFQSYKALHAIGRPTEQQ